MMYDFSRKTKLFSKNREGLTYCQISAEKNSLFATQFEKESKIHNGLLLIYLNLL